MFAQKIAGCAAAAIVASLVPMGASQAAMRPAVYFQATNVQHVDCAVGFHIGPAGACIIGVEEPRTETRVIERREVERRDDCATRTVKKTNGEGDSVTKTTTKCD